MKKNFITFLSIVFIFLSVTACSWQIPEKVYVKTNAEYNFSLGDVKKDLTEIFNTDQIFSKLSDTEARVYDYYPVINGVQNSKVQQYLLRFPIMEVPVDFSSYFNTTGLASQIEGMSFKKDIEIPDISISKIEEIDASGVSSAINSSFSFTGEGNGGLIKFGMEFEKVLYSTGSLVIVCSDAADNSSVTITSGSESRKASFNSQTATVSLDNFTINKNDTSISFNFVNAGSYAGKIASDSIIEKATGLTSSDPLEVPVKLTTTISDADGLFESCTIKEGSLNTKIKLPLSWKNVNISYGISSSGGLTLTTPVKSGTEQSFDLCDAEIVPGDAEITANLSILLNNASFTTSNITLEVSSAITSYKKLAIILSGVNTSVSKTESLPDLVLKSVKSIKLGQCGVKGTYTNTFPQGNDIELKASSSFFGMSEKSAVISSDKIDQEISMLSSSTEEKTINIVESSPNVSNGEYNSWDFSVDFVLPGATTEKPSRFEVKDVVSGQTYTLALSLTPQLNWIESVINFSSIKSSSKSGIQDLGFNFSTLFNEFDNTYGSDFIEKIKFSSIPVYFYCNKPEIASGATNPFDSLSFEGTAKLFINDNASLPSESDKIITFFENESLEFENEPLLKIEDNTVVSNLASYSCSKMQDVSTLLNLDSKSGNLYLDYNLTLKNGSSDDITITREMFSEENNTGSIGVTAYLVLPLEFTASDDISIDVLKLMGNEITDDVFGREEATTDENIKKYLAAVSETSFIYDLDKILLYSNPDLFINLKFDNSSIDKKFYLHGGKVSLTGSELNEMISVYPLIPKVSLGIEKDASFSIVRDFQFAANLAIQLKTDGSIELFGGQE